MALNIGWFYNKKYYEALNGDPTQGAVLERENDTLIGLQYDEWYQKQLLDERAAASNSSGPYRSFRLKTGYPGLITGVGINHQTTIKWKNGKKDVPEFKLGMQFDHTTGLPVIPGSSLKGLLRDAFPIDNQKNYCDHYEEKCRYIAAIIERNIRLKDRADNKAALVAEIHRKKLADFYQANRPQTEETSSGNGLEQQIETLRAQKEQQLYKEWEDEKISEDQLNHSLAELNSSGSLENITRIVKEERARQENENIENFFSGNSKLRRQKNAFLEKAENEFDNATRALVNAPLPDEASDEWMALAPQIALEIFEGIRQDGTRIPPYERDVFFDAIPYKGDREEKLFEKDYITPHKLPLKDPVPICLMKIRPDVTFQFFFRLHDGILSGEQKLQLFEYILCDRGTGAKTHTGYGQLEKAR